MGLNVEPSVIFCSKFSFNTNSKLELNTYFSYEKTILSLGYVSNGSRIICKRV